MNEYEAIRVLVPKDKLNEITEKGFVEAVSREMKSKRYAAFDKLQVLTEDESSKKEAADEIQKLIKERKDAARELSRFRKDLERGLSKTNDQLKSLSLDAKQIYQNVSKVANLEYLNIGLSGANLVVDIIGFAVVCNQLSKLDHKAEAISDKVNTLNNIKKNEKMMSGKKLTLRINSMRDKMRFWSDKGMPFDVDAMEEILIDISNFIEEMVEYMRQRLLNVSDVLEVVFPLLGGYTAILYQYLKTYYFQRHFIPENEIAFMKVYNQLLDSSTYDCILDYYLVDQKMHYSDVLTILNAQNMLILNHMARIEDMMSIIQAFDSQEEYQEFDEKLNQMATA